MKQEIENATRFGQAAQIALYAKMIKVKDEDAWWVYSLTNPLKHYVVTADGSCTCPDYHWRGGECKHALGLRLRFTVMHEIREVEA